MITEQLGSTLYMGGIGRNGQQAHEIIGSRLKTSVCGSIVGVDVGPRHHGQRVRRQRGLHWKGRGQHAIAAEVRPDDGGPSIRPPIDESC